MIQKKGNTSPLLYTNMLSFLLIASAVLSQNLIKNGDFEDGTSICTKLACVSSNPTGIAPWFVTSAIKTYQLALAPIIPAFSGKSSLALNSDTIADGAFPYTIGQNVATPINSACTVTFEVNEDATPQVKFGFVRATGGASQTFFHSVAISKGDWIPVTYNFVATSTTTLLEIGSSMNGTFYGPVIDAVRMTCSARIVVVPVTTTSVVTTVPVTKTSVVTIVPVTTTKSSNTTTSSTTSTGSATTSSITSTNSATISSTTSPATSSTTSTATPSTYPIGSSAGTKSMVAIFAFIFAL